MEVGRSNIQVHLLPRGLERPVEPNQPLDISFVRRIMVASNGLFAMTLEGIGG